MIDSLYIVDSSGICLFSLPLSSAKQFEPNLLSGFLVAEYECLRDAYGEDAKRLSLERKEILIRKVPLKTRNLLLVIVHTSNGEKEDGYSEVLLDHLAEALKKEVRVVKRLPTGVADESDAGFDGLVEKTLKSLPCPYASRGIMGIKHYCRNDDSPIKNHLLCDFSYATRICPRYKREGS